MLGTVLGTGDTALKNIKRGPCPPGTCRSPGVVLAPGQCSVSSEIFFWISQIFFLCIAQIFPLEGQVATSVAILTEERLFSPVLQSARLSHWPGLDRVHISELDWPSLSYWEATIVCASFQCKEDKAGTEIQCRAYLPILRFMTLSAGEGGAFYNSHWDTQWSWPCAHLGAKVSWVYPT